MAEKPTLKDTGDPSTTVGLDGHANGTYEYVTVTTDEAKSFKLAHKGRDYRHVATDARGIWLYR